MLRVRMPSIRRSVRSRTVRPLARAFAATATLLGLASCGPLAPPRGAAFDPDTIPEAYARPTGALMWPGAARAFLVTPAGDLYGGEWLTRFEASADGRAADPPRVIAAEERWLPVLHWNRRAGSVRFEFEAAAFPEPAPRDTGLVASVAVRVVNAGPRAAAVRLLARLAPPGADLAFRAPDAPQGEGAPRAWAGAAGAAAACGWSDLPLSAGAPEASWTLAPGESRRARFLIPAYPSSAGALAQWAGPPHAARAAAARRFWQAEVERGATFELGDAEVEHAIDAARVVLLGSIERRGDAYLPIGNPFQYRDVWLRDGARAVRALAVAGHVREARQLADGLLLFQWPNGAILSQRGQLDGTGEALWALEQALLRPSPDGTRLDRACDAAMAAVRWIETQRRIGRASGWEHGAMLPFAEPRDDELARAQLVGSDAWAIAGELSAVHLLRAAGRLADAESVDVWRRVYRSNFRAQLEQSGSPDVPPSWQGAGRDWGNLAVATPCGVLDAGDPRVAALARRMWAAAGGAGLVTRGSPDSLHTYLGADLATWALIAGRRAAADSVLDAMLHWRTASGGAGEIVSRSTRDVGANLPPHATSAAALVSLVRDMLVYDENDTLRLTLGARAAWWRGAALRAAPTRFGRVDLEFARVGDVASWRWSPVEAWTALTLPPGTRPASLPAPLVAGPAPDVVLAPPNTREARVPLVARGAR